MPKLTKEERKAKKLEKKLKKKQQAELLRRQLLHDQLSREINYAQINIREHEKKWKQMLIDIALPRMKTELEYAWHNFEKVIDFKDFEISFLLDELNDGEEQYLMNFRNHSENIEKLIIKFEDYLGTYKKKFEETLDQMKADAENEAEEMNRKTTEAEEYFKTMLFGLEVAKKEQEKLVRGDYLSKLDEESAKYTTIIQNLQIALERKYNDVWDFTKRFFNNYHNNTAVKLKLYNALLAQDDAVQKVCVEQAAKLVTMQKYYKKLREQHGNIQKKQEKKLTDLLSERQYFADAFWALKLRLTRDRNIDNTNLTVLTIESNLTREHLLEVVEKGRKILQLGAVCRKLETDYEIILPFPKSLEEKFSSTEDIDERGIGPIAELDTFWQRVARADAIRNSIYEEKKYLKMENLILKQKLHEYCNCMECPAMETKPAEIEKHKSGRSVIPMTDCKLMQLQYAKHQ